MAAKVTFLHTADLHLGAPLRGGMNLDGQWADRIAQSVTTAFKTLVRAALESNVDFVVIAGDVFDASHPSYAQYQLFTQALDQLQQAGIPAYYCAGNHDPYVTWLQDFDGFPPNLTVFGTAEATFAAFEKDGHPLCLLGGRSYYTKVWSQEEDITAGISRAEAVSALAPMVAQAQKAPFMVGVVHTGLNLDPYKAPADPDDLMRRDVDYWACGHIHSRYIYPQTGDPKIVYPGCIQGREISETGPKGAFLVTLEQGQPVKLVNVPTAAVALERIEVDASDCATLAELREKITRELFRVNGNDQCDYMFERLTLTGYTALQPLLANPAVLENLRVELNNAYKMFFCDVIINATALRRGRHGNIAPDLHAPALPIQSRDVSTQRTESLAQGLEQDLLKRGVTLPDMVARKSMDLHTRAANLVESALDGEEVW